MILRGKHILYLYFFLWIVYELQELLGLSGSALSLCAILVINAISIFYCIKLNRLVHDMPIYFKALNIMILLFTLYGIIYCLDGEHYMILVKEENPYNYLKTIYNSLLPIYVFSYFSWKGVLTRRMMCIFGCLFFIMVFLSYWGYDLKMKSILLERGGDRDGFVNNMGYEFLCLFPILTFYYKRPIFQYLGVICVMTFILMGMKRGAILIGFFCMVWFLLEMFKSAKNFKKLIIILTSIGVVVLLFFLVWHLLMTSDFFRMRIQSTIEGNVSGRSYLYTILLNYFLYDTNAFQFFFGSGANATLEVSFNYAHNDWLEILVNQGVLGFCAYLFYWISFFMAWRKTERTDNMRLAMGLLFFIYFMRTFFSMSYGNMNIYSTSVLGVCLGNIIRSSSFSKGSSL